MANLTGNLRGPTGPTGPGGPAAVSTDAGNSATLGADALIYVPLVNEVTVATVDPLPGDPTVEFWYDPTAVPGVPAGITPVTAVIAGTTTAVDSTNPAQPIVSFAPKIEVYDFPAGFSCSATAAQTNQPIWCGIPMARARGDVLTDLFAGPVPTGGNNQTAAGPSPLPYIHFLTPGLYRVDASLTKHGPGILVLHVVDAAGNYIGVADAWTAGAVVASLDAVTAAWLEGTTIRTAEGLSTTINVLTANVYLRTIISGTTNAVDNIISPTMPGSMIITKLS